jgi:hypothetical protein
MSLLRLVLGFLGGTAEPKTEIENSTASYSSSKPRRSRSQTLIVDIHLDT